eukprot:TRINITY_DN2559_c0_g1_i13.p2 TRINITY_DN2559_c0_g1~~TRINITY_DN2559_c0_g1_i13.p2  ORF type:complete len:244 (-),score=12.11 TRINITY_DN2559_c0_g1_i13:67-744(-)
MHSTAKFFKQRRYLTLEFPILQTQNGDNQPALYVFEIGCGCGSSIIPILQSNTQSRAVVCDISSSAIQRLNEMSQQCELSNRIKSYVFDASKQDQQVSFGPIFDVVLLIFTLSVVEPQHIGTVLQYVYNSLVPGGQLLFRDYGLYDHTQLRFRQKQKVQDCLYQRQDGTLSYYFGVEDIVDRVQKAGFEVIACKYACVITTNKKKGTDIKRVYMHGCQRLTKDGV